MKSKQEKLANLFVQDVPKFGGSRETLLQCAKKLKISTPNLALLFPSFEYDVLKFLIAQNNALVEKNYNSFNNSRLKVRDKIKTILELKLRKNYEKPSERKLREKAESIKRFKKLMRKKKFD